jgi:hypothetical protein
MKRRFSLFIAFVSLLAPVFGISAVVHAASGPAIYFAETNVTAAQNSRFKLAIRLDAHGTAVNTVNIIVHFPSSQLNMDGLDKGGSYFDTILPAAPTAKGDSVTFSAASINAGPTTGDTLIGTLSFTAKAASGSATLSLDGSQAANAGAVVTTTTATSRVDFAAPGAANGGNEAIGITNIAVRDVTLRGGVVHWQTTTPSTSSVDYGADGNYGLTAGSAELVKDHAVDLGSNFPGKTTVHFRVTSVDTTGSRQSSADQIFTTLGYLVHIQVVDKNAKPLSGADVMIGTSKTVKTDTGGYATIANVAAGSQKVFVNGQTQNITVKALKTADATTTPQEFKLVASAGMPVGIYVGIALVILLLAILGTVLYRKPPSDAPTAKAEPQIL